MRANFTKLKLVEYFVHGSLLPIKYSQPTVYNMKVSTLKLSHSVNNCRQVIAVSLWHNLLAG